MSTLKQYRQYTAKQLGRLPEMFYEGTADSSSTTAVLVDVAWPVKTTADVSDLFVDKYILRPAAAAAADKVRQVKLYDPTSGSLTPDHDWTAAPDAEVYELHGLFEPLTELHYCIGEALKRCLLTVEFTLTPVAAQNRHSLAVAAPWLSQPSWVRQVGWLTANEDRDEVDPFARVVRGQAVKDGATVYIDHPGYTFSDTQTLYVKAIKPAYYDCKASGGTYGGQSGLSLDTDEAVPDLEWVAAGALVEAWNRYGHVLEAAGSQRLLRDQSQAASWFTTLCNQQFTPPELTFRPIRYWGPSRG